MVSSTAGTGVGKGCGIGFGKKQKIDVPRSSKCEDFRLLSEIIQVRILSVEPKFIPRSFNVRTEHSECSDGS